MRSADKIRRAINFDLCGKGLVQYFSESNPNDAYRVLGKFFHDNGFEHRQGSGYVSKEALTKAEVIRIVDKLNEQFPWLGECASCIDVTNIGKTYDMKKMLKQRERLFSEKVSIKSRKNNQELNRDS